MIIILRLNIENDIKNLHKKIIDISLISEDSNDTTFFNIDDEEIHETLKTLKKTYVTSNSKDETILNLKHKTKKQKKDTRELKLESYKKYNEALNMIQRKFMTSAIDIIEEALELNPKDVDILNLKGLLKLLKCNFDEAFESFYKSSCYDNNELAKKYVNILSSEEFNIFLSRYNHAVRFVNNELYQESIQILENIRTEEPELIEPYLLLHLIYEKLGDNEKANEYMDKLREVDKDNLLFEKDIVKTPKKEEEKKEAPKKQKSHMPLYTLIAVLVLAIGALYLNNKKKMNHLNDQVAAKEEKLTETSEKLDKTKDELKEVKTETDKTKEEQAKSEVIVGDEEELFNQAMDLKKEGKNEEAIKYLELVVKNGKTKKYISEAIYQLAQLNEKTKHNEEAIKYYKKYVNTYKPSDNYYDDSYYNMGMLYYKQGDLEKAQQTFYSLRAEDPDSMYNNSQVESILKER
ncbi:MAG: tetratricopeptide repeat protein [Paraclostridium bifermentans]|nr:tetratricopeptide repeat protein [Paraclostridium bifermentans]MBS6507296.1 tetratricopeptide repeat protein [Paraclostridium bifermentans]MCE9674831.1 tetratricopeptide repeat protein [Paraclostridium bifermentans]MCR1874723.1 tetratricopeptide repeat protein [Paraclostridium bifermentans]MDU3801760.1 tetratricopeptide repeat protein [Paraclostridium bifermentans]OSB11826.1 multiprotein complex assembly protein [Paraclostridium bifermentans]